MWSGTLQGSDIQQANAKLKDQHSAIRAHLKHLETRIADLEALERSIVNFVSNYEVEDGSSAIVANPGPATEKDAGEIATERGRSTSSGTATVVDLAPATEKDAGEIAAERGRSTSSGTATVVDPAPVTERVAGEIATERGRSTSSGTATVVDPAPVTEKDAGEIAGERGRSTSSETATVADLAPVTERVAGEQRKNTWLNSEKLTAVWSPAERKMHAIAQTR